MKISKTADSKSLSLQSILASLFKYLIAVQILYNTLQQTRMGKIATKLIYDYINVILNSKGLHKWVKVTLNLYEIWAILMRHDAAPRVEGVRERVVHQVWDVGRVDVGEAEQAPREVSRVVVCTEHATELWVKYCLYFVPAIDITSPTIAAWKQNTKALIYSQSVTNTRFR